MRLTSRAAMVVAAATLSAACLSKITLPDPDPAFTTNATSYTFAVSGTIQEVTISYTYQDASGEVTALEGCTGGATRWFLEKNVNGTWEEVYPVCTANGAEGKAVAANGSYASTLTITDALEEGASPRISRRPVAGTYRIRFSLFDNLNLATGVGSPVTDGRQYSNTFTLQ